MTGAVDWSGSIGSVWAEEWMRTDRSFIELAPHLDAAIRAALGQGRKRVVDIGSGAGTTSIALATARPDVEVIGIDISPDLVEVARRRGAALANLSFRVGAVEALAAELAPIDLLVSRHGVMFFADPVAAFAPLRAAMAPGGSLVFSCFRPIAENLWASAAMSAAAEDDLLPPSDYEPGPFAFADPEFVGDLLARAGWSVIETTPVDYVYHAGEGEDAVGDALSFFRRIGPTARLLREADEAGRAAMIARLTELLTARLHRNRVDFEAAAWLWSATAA